MSEFTKGPWKWDVGDDKWEHRNLTSTDGYGDIIELQDVYPGYSECGQDLVMVIKPEDAHLIAAAPDMYEALELLLANGVDVTDRGKIGGKNYNIPTLKRSWDKANEALAKAKGESE